MGDVGAIIAIVLFMAIGFVVAAWLRQSRFKALGVAWQQVARDHDGLGYGVQRDGLVPRPVIAGTLRGERVRAEVVEEKQGKRTVYRTAVRARVAGLLPAGLRMVPEGLGWKLVHAVGLTDIEVGDPELDRRLRITAADADAARAALSDGAVVDRLQTLLAAARRVSFEGDELSCVHDDLLGEDVATLMEQTVAAAGSLGDPLSGPWTALAEQHGLGVKVTGDAVRVDGLWHGTPIRARVGRHREEDTSRTRVRAQVRAPLPPGLAITLREEGERPGIPLPDPILGRLLTVRCDDADAAVALLDDDALRATLLEVVHGHPGSSVYGDAVRLELPGFRTRELHAPLDLASELARALERRTAPKPKSEPR